MLTVIRVNKEHKNGKKKYSTHKFNFSVCIDADNSMLDYHLPSMSLLCDLIIDLANASCQREIFKWNRCFI